MILPLDDHLDLGGTTAGRATADRTPALAERLGVDVDWFLELFGGPWYDAGSPALHDFDGDPSGGDGYPVTPWHVTGRPVQLMVRVFTGHCFLARPEGRWAGGTHDLVWEEHDQVHLTYDDLRREEIVRPVVAGLVSSRRRRLRWCERCREQQGPETMLGALCHGCAQGTGVVF
ncbi:hypothetical protein [uncultured Nocardioides sp.]|uniref:hypothetical protein n=1 Tax=uncultured Nocardioides sp. TaxID=198441 RepID=UPI002604B2D1|nr:hypothetical protein [uncultured Nocardioides sp.]